LRKNAEIFRQQISSVVARATEGREELSRREAYRADSFEEHAALGITVLDAIADSVSLIDEARRDYMCQQIVGGIGAFLTNQRFQTQLGYGEDALDAIRDIIDGLGVYLDECLDARNVLQAVLLKYKQRCEWFHRNRLCAIADTGLEGRKGERALALDLHEYILDQGVEFYVEPASVSGEADIVLRDPDGWHLILDAKYIPEKASRSEIVEILASGFNQVVRYCKDYNETEGFLVVFTRTPKKIRLELEEDDGLRYLKLGGKTVYYLEIDIATLPSASREGRATEFEISAEELVASVSDTGVEAE